MLNISPLKKQDLPLSFKLSTNQSLKSIHSLRNQPLADIIEFKGRKSKLEEFNELPRDEQQQIQTIIRSILKEDPELLLTLNGTRAATLATLVHQSPRNDRLFGNHVLPWMQPKSSIDIFEKNKKLVETEDIKILTKNKSDRITMLFINLPKAKELVEQNLDIFRYKFNEPDMTTNQVMDIIMGKDTPLFSNNYEDLLGTMLGFPSEDALVFNLYHQIKENIKFLQNRGAQVHQRVLSSLIPILRPDYWQPFYIKINHERAKEEYTNFYKAFDIPVPDSKMPAGSPVNFISWNSESKSMKKLREDILKDYESAKAKFKSPEDVCNHLLITK